MAKEKRTPKQRSVSPIIPLQYQHFAAAAVIFLSLVIFFYEIVFNGKVFVAADTIASRSFQTLVHDAADQGIAPLWNPYIFCGMPGVGSMMVGGARVYDFSAYLYGIVAHVFSITVENGDIAAALFYYLLLGIGTYVFTYSKVKSKFAALISGLAVMHSTSIVSLIMAGHMTKVPVVAFFPWIFLVIERLKEKFSFTFSLILVLLVHFMLMPGHIQMIFYVYFAFGIYYIVILVFALSKQEEWKGIIRSGIILAAASGIGFLMTGDQYLSTLEYSKYSMRGSDPIVQSQQAAAKGATSGGLDYDYATQWSYSPGEIVTLLVPSWYGFGTVKYQGVLTQNREVKVNTYMGPMPIVEVPQYMGIIVLMFAAIGFWKNRKDVFILYCGILILVSLLISFGKEFPLFFDLMFNYFPLFNKFRIPVMILILVQLVVPVLAGYGLVAAMNGLKDQKEKKMWLYALITSAVFFIVSIIAKDIFLSLHGSFFSKDAFVQKGYHESVASELFKFVSAMVASDITVAGFLLTVSLGGWYLYWNKKITFPLLAAGIIALVLFDLWRVNAQPMDPQTHQAAQDYFSTPDYVKFLQQDTSLYRTLQFDERGQPPYDNTLAYWRIQSAYGYSGTKMRQIQDAFDVVGLGNPLFWGLMNVKYIISARPDSNQVLLPVYRGEKNVLYNRATLPRAFFVNRYEVAHGLEILNNIKEMKFHPHDLAYGMEKIDVKIDPPQENASVQYTHYGIQDLALKVNATGNNLIFLSESWYPEGWKAYIDGNEIPIYRLNYMFRGVIVPQGEHTVTMKFEPRGYYVGKNISLVLNVVVLGFLFANIVVLLVKRKNNLSIKT
jgi:hypothetical protein